MMSSRTKLAVTAVLVCAIAVLIAFAFRAFSPQGTVPPSPTVRDLPESNPTRPVDARLEPAQSERVPEASAPTSPPPIKSEAETIHAEDDLKDLALETDHRKSELRIIRHRLKVVAEKKVKNPLDTDESFLIMQSIAAVLDDAGRGFPESGLADKAELMKELAADSGFSLNGKYYVFDHGEFPEWSERVEYRRRWGEWSDKSAQNPSLAGPPPEFTPTIDYYSAIEARAELAIELLSRHN